MQIDEPRAVQRYADDGNLSATYAAIKQSDPNHPVIINHDPYSNTATNDYVYKSQGYADIIAEDHYTIRATNPTRSEYLYYYERISATRTFAGGKSVDNYTKPFWAVVQANGRNANDSGGSVILGTTSDEVRLETFNAITIGYNGVGYWAYNTQAKNATGQWENEGTWSDPALWQGVKNLHDEIKGLNDILVLPDVGRSWYMHENDAAVLLTHPNMTKTITGYGIFRKLNYALKKDAANNWYLIIVNKDMASLSNVNIKVNGITGSATATTLGGKTTGSGRAGRAIAVANGQFTDSFDAYAVHSYKISPATTPSQSYTFYQTGLPAGILWGVTVNGQRYTSTTSSIIVSGLSGEITYQYDTPVSAP